MPGTKIEMVKHLQLLVRNIDEKAILESEDKFYWVANKTVLLKMDAVKLAKRARKEGIQSMIDLYSKYQMGGKIVGKNGAI